jgi:hypothetical protein
LLGQFKSSNYEYIKEIDTQRKNSKYVAKTKNGQTILYASFDEDYKINPTNALDYINQYEDKL